MIACQRPFARALIVAAFGLYLAVQLIVPVVRFNSADQARFAWQMFARSNWASEYVVVTRQGESLEVQLDDYLAFPRGDLGIERALPLHLCGVIPEAQAVQIGADRREVRCP